MESLPNYNAIEVFKAYNKDVFKGFVFSIQSSEYSDELEYRYYMISIDKNNIPNIKKLNNTILLLNNEQITLTKIEKNSIDSKVFKALILMAKTLSSKTKNSNSGPHFSQLTDTDLQLLKSRF